MSAVTALQPERRRDPDDGRRYTLEELHAKYEGDFSSEEISDYWLAECTVLDDEIAKEKCVDDGKTPCGWRASECIPMTRGFAKISRPGWAAQWLLQVDPQGNASLLRHAEALERTFQNLDQLVATYWIFPPACPQILEISKVLDHRLFADFGIQSERDISLVKEWFTRVHGLKEPLSAEKLSSFRPESSSVTSALRRCGKESLDEWLLEVDPPTGERLACYRQTILENFDNLRQITDTYVTAQRVVGQRRRQKMLDHHLFEDLSVDDPAHRDLFVAWFAAKCGAGYEEPPPPPPSQPKKDLGSLEDGRNDHDSFWIWPQDIPREQQMRARRLLHSDVESWYPRERVHGPLVEQVGSAAYVDFSTRYD
eukprot:gnl/TRDRNA2_/TRDRNA2_201104_c0_seq1.p1 gnl/TRDRNA2_/TRDRNA2_201104_c0~~gnl/TRDRNA2_/TRDRNA2_201104_c0_seq1.p1  ORF type:complete len:389 (+),score=50.25 gnl/TRDRNA2_/TRDRNA2_201104_c0_seq1:66-1169(+)